MDLVIENNKSPTKQLKEVAENEVEDKAQCSVSNDESKCGHEVEEKGKDELNMLQPEYNENIENIENNCEPVLNLDSIVEAQKDILCSVSKEIVNDKKDDKDQKDKEDKKDPQKKSDVQSTLSQDPDNMAIEEIADSKNERPTEEESNDQNTLNQIAEVNTDNAGDENETSVQNTDQVSSSSTQIQVREKCKYGSQCYRLNAEHKARFGHPGDTDYNDLDNRPECPYGVQCYRKNPQHKLDYKHTCTKRKRTQNPGQTATLDDFSDFEESMEESVDESDEYDGSFIDDDDLDDDFESDLDSDQLDEENEDDENSEDKDGQKKKKVNNKTNIKKRKKAKND